jgi:import receptor subunit TOM70
VWSQDQTQITTRKGRLTIFSDYTATTILGKFQNDAAGRSVERVLEKLSKKKTAEILAVSSSTAHRESRLSCLTYLFNRAASAVSLPTHSFLPISQPSDYVCLPFHPVSVSFPVTSIYATGPLPALPENPSIGDNTLIMALEALGASDYAHSFSLVNEAIEQSITWEHGRAEALNLRGTFKSVFFITLIVPELRTAVGS